LTPPLKAAGLIDHNTLLAGTAKLSEKLAEIQEILDLGKQRMVLREAFERIRIVPRGKGRPKRGEPAWKPEIIQTAFTSAWS